MPATATGRGAQVILTAEAQAVARGAYASTLEANIKRKLELEAAGYVADGSTPDGTTLTGEPAYDTIVAASAP